jgi:hypothetical protein
MERFSQINVTDNFKSVWCIGEQLNQGKFGNIFSGISSYEFTKNIFIRLSFRKLICYSAQRVKISSLHYCLDTSFSSVEMKIGLKSDGALFREFQIYTRIFNKLNSNQTHLFILNSFHLFNDF